eukprot:m.157885 g.157885  ORF g.157885 m.157885 type:complete len:687 (+) comp14336_c0_seq1:42-2102(+)
MKVFVDQVDRYCARALAELLSKTVVGATQEPEEEEDEDDGQTQGPQNYQVVGTLSTDPEAQAPSFVSTIVSDSDRSELKQTLMECDYIVYHITPSSEIANTATWAAEMLNAELDSIEKPKTFVCISSVLTWGKTKATDPDDSEFTLTEDEYRRRRAHDAFKAQIDAEKAIVKAGKKTKGKLKTFVVAAGLLYGKGEDVFHTLFRQAWEQQVDALPLYGGGENYVPTIHVMDLCNTVLCTMEGHAESKYVVAVDEAQSTLREITESISTAMGPTAVAPAELEEMTMQPGVTQTDMHQLSINQRFELGAVGDFPFEWVARDGFVEAIANVVVEYKISRKLQPIRICVLGPPAVGATTLAKKVAAYYKLPYLSKETVVDDYIGRLKKSAALLVNPPEDVDTEQAEADQQALLELEGAVRENGGAYTDAQILDFFKDKLDSMVCKNHGYVMDAYPLNEEAAASLFQNEEEEEEDDEGSQEASLLNPMPEYVFSLDLSDELLKEKVMALPEKELTSAFKSETDYVAKLKAFRAANTEDNTVLNFFDFREVHPIELSVQGQGPQELLTLVCDKVGVPHNYGPTDEERQEMERQEAEQKARQEAMRQAELQVLEAQEQATAAAAQAEWDVKLREIRRQEREALDEAAVPLRTFLMRHVMPTLTKGLMEVCKTRPEDPVDFLAEYLFKQNPQIN